MDRPPAYATSRLTRSHTAHSGFARDFVEGLAAHPRRLAPKYFYDTAGSALFDHICALPEYYPTRTEIGILRACSEDIAACIGPGAQIVEFGAGSVLKIRLLLDALHSPAGFIPIDISGEHLHAAAAALQRDYPAIPIEPVVGDFTAPITLPACPAGARRVGFFPGSSLGNFEPDDAIRFLRHAAENLHGGGMLIGIDLVKDPARLHAAYNDAAGVTAAFNRNVLVRAQRELGAELAPERFAHYAFYNAPLRRIEMHLVSETSQRIVVLGRRFDFTPGDTLHTENSYKYTIDDFRELARSAGYSPGACWCDPDRSFSLHWLAMQ
ncbi:L-histidine N(alpha)-methyltransferase [Niveibacterium sp. COAC-50]|uniref:L-histidine N(alpha)-methyltransferase n=1 Tax=Niveibacterium sp. COAC-50 TaxID=2729384 RepID=UPI0015571BCB|nr:L-histidine N(alpha)-methyltransferase [Niveibacterium sp. COAC-50]